MPEQEQPQQQTFPVTNFSVTRDGVLINIMIMPTLQITQLIPEQSMNQIVGQWLESRKQLKQELQLIQDIKEGKDLSKMLAKGRN